MEEQIETRHTRQRDLYAPNPSEIAEADLSWLLR